MFPINRSVFFNYARNAPLGGRLTQEQVDGMNCIFNACIEAKINDRRWVAYILATAFHETGGRMVPVREGFAKDDETARRIIKNRKYGKPDATSNGYQISSTGHVFYGRGHVQLTWADNYYRMGKILGIDLLNNPDLALDNEISAKILVEGMTRGKSSRGDFTGKALEDYFNDTTNDPEGARRIVNGSDKASLIATYHKNFLDSLNASAMMIPVPDHKPELGQPDKPNLLKDKTLVGGASAIGATGVASSLFSSIDNPWALGAFALAAIIAAGGAYLFLSGRLQIVRKAGA